MKKNNPSANLSINGHIRSSAAEYLTFIAATGSSEQSFEMRYEDENIWLTQKMMATLYEVEIPTINEHIAKIFADSELEETATIRNFRRVQTEGLDHMGCCYGRKNQTYMNVYHLPKIS